ncbi:tryptophanase leader peptide [Parasalinivibrio latis]
MNMYSEIMRWFTLDYKIAFYFPSK